MNAIRSIVAFALCGATLLAQGPPPRFGRGAQAHLMGATGFEGRTVTGAPYTAQAVTTITQTLPDGNQIVNTSTAIVARDSQGRTRREQTVKAVGEWSTGTNPPTMVFIHDPVAQSSYVLEPNTKTARKMTIHSPNVSSAQGGRFGDRAARNQANTVSESLGSKMIAGVQAEGQRTTRTIPAGQIGNAQPITIVKEVWTSPELQTVVMSRFSDPRSGETVYTLTNIQRSEPDASLFAVPSGYTVTESPRRGR